MLAALQRIWHNMTSRRMYISGGVGGKGAGESTRGDPVHEAFQGDYELPNDCYCETCANIGNAMWNWRLLQATGEARFADVMEQVLYNAGLSGVSVAQDRFFYCNPMEWRADATPSHGHQTATRWDICDCYCCPPQIARTLSSLQTWAYGVGDDAIWVHLYGGSKLAVQLPSGAVRLTQVTDYPWDGQVRITIDECPATAFTLRLRIPGWCEGATLSVNGRAADGTCNRAAPMSRSSGVAGGRRGRVVAAHAGSLDGIASRRGRQPKPSGRDAGPLALLRRSTAGSRRRANLAGRHLFSGTHDRDAPFRERPIGRPHGVAGRGADGGRLSSDYVNDVVSKSAPVADSRSWDGVLYRPLAARPLPQPVSGTVQLDLIPYYAWANRGVAFMQVWTPLAH